MRPPAAKRVQVIADSGGGRRGSSADDAGLEFKNKTA